MAPGKNTEKRTAGLKSVCPECDEVFAGSSCTTCGNTTGNQKLASDGIRQQDHRHDNIFGDADRLEGYSRTPDDVFMMDVQNAKMANAEYVENLRQAQVMKSQLKRIDIEEQLLKKQSSLDRLKGGVTDTYPPEHQPQESAQSSMAPLFGSQSPQAQFMSQLMKMDNDRRGDFIAQLSDADPQALSTLSSMFVQPMQNQGMSPGGMYPPPWMMQPPAPQKESESSVTLMKEMFSLMKEMQPPKDNSTAELIRDLKDELKSLHNRIDIVSEHRPQNDAGMKPILDHISKLEQKIDASQYRPNFKDQAMELKETINALESIGLVNGNSSTISFEDKLKMKELDHQIDMDSRRFNLDLEQTELKRSTQSAQEGLVKQLFTNSFKSLIQAPEEAPVPKQQTYYPPQIIRPKTIVQPVEVVGEFESDAGQVRQVKSSKYNTEE